MLESHLARPHQTLSDWGKKVSTACRPQNIKAYKLTRILSKLDTARREGPS